MVAEMVAHHFGSASSVVGIYGKWGEGKSTLLYFIDDALQKEHADRVHSVWFNPWRFPDEPRLISMFFTTLAKELGRSISSFKEVSGDFLEKYVAGMLPSMYGFDVNKPLETLGGLLSSVELETLKTRVDEVLKGAGKRIVIFMDDLDRLDREEIKAVFRLVKLTADFENTTYILSFDPKNVSSVLGEAYGRGDEESGRSFLEKIVQVPLQLPLATKTALRQICFAGVDAALDAARIELDTSDSRRFVRHFNSGIEVQLSTPRQGKRYANVLRVALASLKDQVNTVDLMLVEAIRVFYPDLYDTIRDHPDLFLREAADDGERERRSEVVEKAVQSDSPDVMKAAHDLLRTLFPRCLSSGIGPNWERPWAEEKRIASRDYFYRYFSYGIAPEDVSETELAGLVNAAASGEVEEAARALRQMVRAANAESVVSKLRSRVRTLDARTSETLAIALSQCGRIFPRPELLFSFQTPFSQAAILVRDLVENIPARKVRLATGKKIAADASPLEFAVECVNYLRAGKDEQEADRLLDADQEKELTGLMAERIRAEAEAMDTPLYVALGKQARYIIELWTYWSGREGANAYITRTLHDDPSNAVDLLKTFTRTVWGGEDGLPFEDDFEIRDYVALSRAVDLERVEEALVQVYGEVLKEPVYESDKHSSLEERLAHQFIYVRREQRSKNAD